jgi:hypothetical protein
VLQVVEVKNMIFRQNTLNPLKRVAIFNLIFDTTPTYSELTSGTPKLAPYLTLNPHSQNALVPICDSCGGRTHDCLDENQES